MKVFYDEGYPEQSFGAAGKIRVNEPKEIADDLARALIAKGRLKPYTEAPAPAPKRAKADTQEG